MVRVGGREWDMFFSLGKFMTTKFKDTKAARLAVSQTLGFAALTKKLTYSPFTAATVALAER